MNTDLSRRSLLQAALAAGCAPALVSHAATPAAAPLFALGVASGCPRPDGLVLWTRLLGEALPAQVAVRWELAEDEGFKTIAASGTELAEPGSAHSVHAEPAGLRPDRWYWYRFSALGQQSPVGRSRSAPAPGAAVARLRFAIASCQRWDHGEYAAWRDLAGQDLDLLLFLGDYIYESATAPDSTPTRRHRGGLCRTLDDYRQRYAQYKSDPHLQAMHAAAPWLLTWDDHEVENDYAGDVSQHLELGFALRRAAAAQAYWEHLPFPKAARPRGSDFRLHERYDWGALARIITLDNRQWRDPQACPKPGRGGSNTVALRDCPPLLDPGRSLLGKAQEQWLAQSWDRDRPWNLLAQQTLMAPLNWQPPEEGSGLHWTDGWDGYPAARQRLLRDLQAARVRNAVVLGGDVHAHYVSDLHVGGADTPLIATEFCGSSISSNGLAQRRLDQMRPHNPHIHHARSDERGFIRFDLRASRLEAELRAVEQPWDAASALRLQARYVVEAGRAGALSD
ncbi:alkaline phosphatase D family protein [Paucibacter sp. PLA-PC-4]|uniref:alkaline phosphatase D family protein n=1 Tax=Paucibacter sp. PLA-PC-4 TaxID=2993655 RepID=UPI002248F3E3|nr:alkaline phosphatase D family protein [Paucibacter sp. PLA-PC-4]MCX2860474.1 alkaline phosphatase D family protein [Paucibacter sp. PLA-PC-4]